jgi:hypothetical protein
MYILYATSTILMNIIYYYNFYFYTHRFNFIQEISKNLLSPINIATLELKNRVIMPAMGTCMPTIESYVSKQLINYRAVRAKGGCAINIIEMQDKAAKKLGI